MSRDVSGVNCHPAYVIYMFCEKTLCKLRDILLWQHSAKILMNSNQDFDPTLENQSLLPSILGSMMIDGYQEDSP